MRMVLRLTALAATLVSVVLWFFGGPNLGWTKTSVPVKTIEAVTGLEQIVWEKRFLPGVDFLAAGLAAGAVLFGISFIFRKNVPPEKAGEG